MRIARQTVIFAALCAFLTGSHCVKNYPDDPLLALAAPPSKYTITVQVSGASGPFSVSNNGDIFNLSGSGAQVLQKEYTSGTAFNVTIAADPTGQSCTVAGGTGILTASVSNVMINCVNTGINSITQDRDFISADATAYTTVQISFQVAYDGSYRIKSGTDCASGTDYPDASATGSFLNGATVNVTLNTQTGSSPLVSGPTNYIICGYDTGPTLQDEIVRTVTVDNTPPTLTPSQAPGNLTAATSVSITCTDSQSGCNGVAVVSQSAPGGSAPPNPADPNINFDGTGATPGLYSGAISVPDLQVTTIEAFAVDIAGNRSASVQSYQYAVDSSFSNISGEGVTNSFISNVGTKTSTVISWSSDRSNRPYTLRINSTNCTDGTAIDTGTTGAGGHTSPAIPATAFTPSTDATYTVRICEENFLGQYDLGTTISVTRDETAPVINAITGNGADVAHNASIVYRFSETVDTTATVIAGGDIENEDDGGAYSMSTFTDDQLTISPSIGFHTAGMMIWAPGLNRALDLTVFDLAGNSATVSHTYNMRDGTVQPYYTNAQDWNYYIKNDGTSGLTATDTVCDGTESAFYFGCLHGGQVRKVMVLDKINDCTGVSATDAQGWMDWYCVPQGAGVPVLLVSGNLQTGKSLKDLIDFTTPAWRTNSVTITGTNVPNAPAATWWNNAVTAIPLGGGSLANPGGVYVQDANASLTGTLDIAADNVTIIMDTGVFLRANGADPMVNNNGKNFTWIEGNFDGNDLVTTSGIRITGPSHFHRLNNVRVWNVQGSVNTGNIHLQNVTDSILTSVRGANSTLGNGLVIEDTGGSNTARNIVVNSTFYNNMNSGIHFIATGMIHDTIVMNSFVAANEADGIFVLGSGGGLQNSIFMNMTVANNGADSFDFGNTSSTRGISLINTVAINAPGTGILFANGSTANQVIDSAIALHATALIDMDSGAQAYFSGKMLLFSPFPDQCINVGPGTGIDDTPGECDPDTGSDHTVNLFNDADPLSSNGAGFVGPAGSNTGYSLALNWVGFATPYSLWGRSGNLFLSQVGLRGRCSVPLAPTNLRCESWDFSLKSSSVELLNGLACPTGNDTITHNWTTANPNSITFLRHAIEDGSDGIADLPFCFGSEGCIYMPNFGGYQGHGATAASGCPGIGTGTTLENINFQEFSNNGF